MITLQSLYPGGNIYVFRYVFERAGAALCKPAHTEEITHNIMVLCGSVAVNIEGQASKALLRGNLLAFDWTLDYHIVALEPNTEVLNLLLFGMPEAYKDLPQSEFSNVVDING